MHLTEGRCTDCFEVKEVVKLETPYDVNGYCKDCLKEIVDNKELKSYQEKD